MVLEAFLQRKDEARDEAGVEGHFVWVKSDPGIAPGQYTEPNNGSLLMWHCWQIPAIC